MCSAYPVAGGQYSWVYILSPKNYARGLSYICGWFMLIGILAMGAVSNFVGANFVLGLVNLNNPGYTIERWHTVLLAYLITFFTTIFNIYRPHLLDRVSRVILIWNISSFVVVVITILSMNDHQQPASFVFSEFQNFTGFNRSYAAILGLLQSGYGMCCYGAPSHMTEEMRNVRKEAPTAIIMSVYIGAVTGFVFLISACFCMGDIETTGSSPTGQPIIEIFYDSVGSRGGATALTCLIVVIVIAEGGRAIYAFARDRGLPFSKLFCTVDRKKQIPLFALLLTGVVKIAFNSIYLGTVTGFNTIISIATEGFYLSYAMPLLARIVARVYGRRSHLEGPWSLGRYGLLLNVVGLAYLLFMCITFNLPGLYPVTAENMNYTSAAISVVMLVALMTWVTTGRRQFSGPEDARVVEGVVSTEYGPPIVQEKP